MQSFHSPNATLNHLHDVVLEDVQRRRIASHVNPLSRHARKVFSQGDEDGITLEIVRRLGIASSGTFAEFGVGNGLENNTLVLASLGWTGFWVGGEALSFEIPAGSRFRYFRQWLSLDNIVQSMRHGLSELGAAAADVISLDLDGNDLHLIGALLASGVAPKLFIAEYNAKFPPPIQFSVRYDPTHTWNGDDYMGASLSALASLFSNHNYKLVCCNPLTGSNAFFVHRDFAELFADVPAEIEVLYEEPRYHVHRTYSHPTSAKTVRMFLE
ncbi:MAG: hypothetical protein H7099_10075 [Gemmatimonadaceae bacterium]|nr:hypothetical protein [Gemmatimonadaceae bacterium]